MRERRAYQRFRCELPVYVLNVGGEDYVLRAVQISVGGLQIEVDKVLLNKMLPGKSKLTPADQIIFEMRLSLKRPGDTWQLVKGESEKPSEDSSLYIKGHVLSVTRHAENRFALHVSFYDIAAEQVDALKKFTSQLKY